jgi:putative oxidoreductase
MSQAQLSETATFLLRVALGLMFLSHSLILKLMDYTLPVTADSFVYLGLPAWFSYVVFALEVAGGTMLVLGIQARWAALVLAPILFGAAWAHWDNGWLFSSPHGGWEYPVYLGLLAVAQFMLGDGRYAWVPSRPLPSFGN